MREREKKKVISLIVMVCMILTMIIGVTTRVQAAETRNVSDYSSLVAAISAASDGDTINITNDITVTSEIAISKALIIEGNNHTITVPVPGLDDSGVYNANPSTFLVFNINALGKTVEINNLTVKGGCTATWGAGILNNSATVLKLTNVNVSNSRAGIGGGGIYNKGTVFLKKSNISRNAASYGGGFLNSGTATMFIENSTFSENRSTDEAGGGGAGENQGKLYANNSTFSNNKSTELGGAINNRPSATAYFVNSTFTGNVAYGTKSGGAIANNGGTSTALNCLFAYNYKNSGTSSSPNYVLDDVKNYTGESTKAIQAYYCVFHALMNATNINNVIGNTKYNGNGNGSDNNIFINGVSAKVLGPDGMAVGTNTIFQPLLAKASGINTPTAQLQAGSFAISKGVKTGFTNGNGSPVIGYYDGTTWVDITGGSSGNYVVTTDQNNVTRAVTPTVGTVETASSMLYMLKVNASTGGTVNGGTIYGDAYAPGTDVTLTAIPNDGYMFTGWNYVDGGTGTASTSNPYAVTVTQNTTLIPVFSATSNKSVTYIGNGSIGGDVPNSISAGSGSQVTVSGNTGNLMKSGYAFAGWNTAANGSGTHYAAGDTFSLTGNVTLYAQWTPVTVPDAPTSAAATAGDGSASVTWMAPSNDGGSPITDYLVDVYNGTTLINMVDTHSTTTSAAITGLTNGTAYTFDVKAVNSVGSSITSSATSAVIPTAPSSSHENEGSSGYGTGSSSGVTITANVVNESNGNNNNSTSTTVAIVNATAVVNSDGTDTVSVKQSDAVVIRQPDGSITHFVDYSKIGYTAPSSAPVTVNSDGTIQVSNLAKGSSYDIPVTYDMGNGQKITICNMHISVDSAGNVNMTSNLIDPYGTLTDSLSGKAISGANVILYYADTARNKAAGIAPNTIVKLPGIDGFKPNNNQNPQDTDSNGAYGFMVYPNTDYYIVVKMEGYDTYTSPTISVATELVKFSAKMNHPITGVKRISGNTRVDTAIELAKSEFTGKVNSIIFATAGNYPDALAGSVLAYNQDAPILLVGDSEDDQNKVLTYMKDYLVTNGKVFILGGTGVVTDNFASEVKEAGYSNIIRLGGKDRYETSSKIADYLNVSGGTPVIIASGENYPDALSVSSAAAVNQYPILLVTNNAISNQVKSQLAKIKPNKVYIIGEQGAISDAVQNQIAQITALDNNSIVRLGGADRYSTSIAIATNFKLSGKSACIATGTNFPDALAGSIYAANYNAPIILVGATLTDEEKAYIQTSKLSGATIFGGDGAVSDKIQNEVTGLLSKVLFY